MNKTPIAIALERQIPEYVRGEYELFVNFIKAYYEFLDQTQQRNLEDIRSIDNTLDEFVIRFKKELSALFPTNSLANERFVLQRIREFYQARGSKESYQFLFRILFNKEADVFYPSTQILRASDGKWVQEKSVFVKITSGDLFKLTGKIITINTVLKSIYVFSPRVVYYRDDIYEVFIDRAYVQDISIGDTVSSEDGLDVGSIIPCPNKYTIVNEGKGFEVGALYYLKTEEGDGSLVKITKIGTGGAIKKVQIISFGLDYNSTFYAKLSNKVAVAVPYRHPIPGPFPDGTTGYIDYGYINKQDYFYYDKFYPNTIAANENVFYADGTYVGEIIGSFYTNASNTNVVDADTAEIKVELGPVAIYPGYYSASDGFISDESYIQDGRYYQLFSYVVRVEQQIESYVDIVKDLLHPAGMELYAEYTIKNQYLVSAAPLLAFIRRQFLEQQFVTDDEATNEFSKPHDDFVATPIENVIKDVVQPKADVVDQPDFRYNDVTKIVSILDSIVQGVTAHVNDVEAFKEDEVTESDNYTDNFARGTVLDTITSVEGPRVFEFAGSTWADTLVTLDEMLPLRFPAYEDIIQMSPYFSNGIQYGEADVFDRLVTYYRLPTDVVIPVESGRDWSINGGTFNQTATPADSVPVRGGDNLKQDSINNINTGTLYYNAYSQDNLAMYDYFSETYGVVDTRALS